MRKEMLLNEEWMFHKGDIRVPRPTDKGPVYTQSKTERKLIGPAAYYYFDRPDNYTACEEKRSEGWKRITLPHDYIIDQAPDEVENNALGYMKYDNAWYRKHFTIEPEMAGKRITLQFEGIAGQATVYCNGCLMKRNTSAYTGFEVDISNNAYFDKENVLAIYVNTEEFEGWWYQGGGIYRDVRLVITDPIAIDLYGVYAPARQIDGTLWAVDFETTAVNDSYEDAVLRAESCLLDADGVEVASATAETTVALREKGVLRADAQVQSPKLWSPDSPYLYTVRTRLFQGDRLLDENEVRIGFRTVTVDPDKGLFINGRHTLIKGVCCHQDFGLTGIYVPDNIARYKIRMIHEMGANAFRTSHYPNAAVNMDTFDELGMLVMDEVRWFEATEYGISQLEFLIKRDRNHPSVIFWSTGNEEPYQITDVGRRIQKAMYACIRKLDTTRFITTAQSNEPERSTVYGDCDVIGINYNLDSYDKIHAAYPQKGIFASECCATGTTRDWQFPSQTAGSQNGGRIQDVDRDTNSWFRARESTWKFLMEREYVMGGFQWAAVEHRGEALWPAICSKSGAIDLYLQRKGAFYQNQSHWCGQPMAHIVPHWNYRGLEGRPIPVTVYTNCDELELFVNGQSRGRKPIERYGHGEWTMPYEPGELLVRGYQNGVLAAEDIRKTTGRPAGLRLRLENGDDLTANGRDIALFTCECVNAEGQFVPDAGEFVSFSASAPAVLIGTGSDTCDHTPVTLAERKMYAGKITVGVRPAKGQETLELIAYSDHIGYAALTVTL